MKKLLLLSVVMSMICVQAYSALGVSSLSSDVSVEPIVYPAGEDFTRLQSIIESTFTPTIRDSYYWGSPYGGTIQDGRFITTPYYNRITENAIKLLVRKTYAEHKEFYQKLFSANSADREAIFMNIPAGMPISDWKNFRFGDSGDIGGELLDASFGIDYGSSHPQMSGMLGALQEKIRDIQESKCHDVHNYDTEMCPWSGPISGVYLPTPEELFRESIFLNGKIIRIDALKDEIIYEVHDPAENAPSETLTYSSGATYTIKYKKENYTYEEAEEAIRTKPSYMEEADTVDDAKADTSVTKDYATLLSGATIPEIPEIFAYAPADAMVLYIKNPHNLIQLLDTSSHATIARISDIDPSKSIKNLILSFFEIQDFEHIEKNLNHEMLVIARNLDATAPDIVLVLSESDRNALSPTAQARVVASKDGYIFVASSKESLDSIQNLDLTHSAKQSSDFQYLWWKKSKDIHDAYFFVGDAFFEKMTTFDNFILHTRKYRDYHNLWSLQEMVWGYETAFGTPPKSFTDLVGIDPVTIESDMRNFSLDNNGTVVHSNIGSLGHIKTLAESQYDLSHISRSEIDAYRASIDSYKEVWQAALDPMGIILNSYGDGVEIDFVMTPLPSFVRGSFLEIGNLLEGTTKDSLDFLKNNHIRSGIVSWMIGIDPQKFQQKIQKDPEMRDGLASFNEEILGGRNIFDYFGGEIGFTIGSLDPDIFDGWNVEKLDIALLIQVKSEEKVKELIDAIRNQILGDSGSPESSMGFTKLLAKPLIEDYRDKKIYYLEGISLPYIGNLSFAYGFIDDFFILGFNRNTIKKYIDAYRDGDARKKVLVTDTSFGTHTFFAMLFDGKRIDDQLRLFYERNPSFLNDVIRGGVFGYNELQGYLSPLASRYIVAEERERRLGIANTAINHIGGIVLTGTGSDLLVHWDDRDMNALSGSTRQDWENFQAKYSDAIAQLKSTGMPLQDYVRDPDFTKEFELLTLSAHAQTLIKNEDHIFRNFTFGMSLGDDEIGFRGRIFQKMTNER